VEGKRELPRQTQNRSKMNQSTISCIVVEDDPLPRADIVGHIHRTPILRLEGVFKDAMSAFNHIRQGKGIQLVFSDILMPGISGMELLKSLANPPLFIFVTASHEYAVESFEYNVADYLVKPYDYPRFLKAVDKARLQLGKAGIQETKSFITVKSGYSNLIVKHDDIFFIKADRVYVEIETLNKTHIVQESLTNMLEKLPPDRFMRVHRSYIVNLDYVEKLTPREIIMQGSIGNIPLGSSFKEAVFQKLGIG